ncbi:hypothetical protein BS47DRAFT_1367659 [Hydnum rufescens UP504]|uniref:Uncharacterized protein n=1 Tax=Hydnum rufescens UP504 TaxID=1448309 RepID=A0A9P6AHL8_9AGAM|nr:hypothetical protein BS47DRAFT_1367659 [Hydnum rufescens UP504]
MEFSLFFCIEIDVTVKSPVKTVPHRDFKNVAIGVCAIFVLGFFNDGETVWLVNFEAKIIIQLPTGIFLLHPSVLIMHFNVDKNKFLSNEHPLKFVCTQNGEILNSLNSMPPCSIKPGRASLVFFNPASFFYPLMTGYTTLEGARAASLSKELDFAEDSTPVVSTGEMAPLKHDPSLGTVHYISPPKMRIGAKKWNQYTAGETYRGWRLKTAFYGGFELTPRDLSLKSTSHILKFELIEEDNRDDSYEDADLLPAALLGRVILHCYRMILGGVNHHQKWRQITADQWLNLLPMLVMPYLHWCQAT